MAALRVSDIDFLRRTLTVDEGVREPGGRLEVGNPKTKASERQTTLSPLLVDVLAAHLSAFPAGDRDGFVFAGERGGTLRPNAFRNGPGQRPLRPPQ